jgi:hypothetical protein
MFQVVVQSAIRNLKSKFKLPSPPSANAPKEEKDKTGFILIVFLLASIFLLAVFSNLAK